MGGSDVMYRFMNIRNGAIAVLVVTLLLCFLATSSYAVTIVPINGNKKIADPGPTPYWDMGEPGHDPVIGINTLSGAEDCINPAQPDRTDKEPVLCWYYNQIEITEIINIIIINIHLILNSQSLDNTWSR